MRPRSPAPPRRAGAAPGQGRAGWVGTGPASPPRRRRRASSGRCGSPALLRGRCSVCASAPLGPHLPQVPHFPGLRTSFPRAPHLLSLLPGLRSSCRASSPTGPSSLLHSLLPSSPPSLGSLPPSRPSHLLGPCSSCTRRERAVTPWAALHSAREVRAWAVGELRVRCAAPPVHCAGLGCRRGRSGVCEPLTAAFHSRLRHCYLRVPRDWFL
ncbi:hypothetical protein NN561_005216 [Cricetulus griseus]